LGRQAQFFDHKRMQQTGEIGARPHAHSRPGLFDGARAADPVSCFEDEVAFAGLGELRRTGEAVVPRPTDNDIPNLAGELCHRLGQPDTPQRPHG
jgi:hypothetical protein